jgi:hypothetical protein
MKRRFEPKIVGEQIELGNWCTCFWLTAYFWLLRHLCYVSVWRMFLVIQLPPLLRLLCELMWIAPVHPYVTLLSHWIPSSRFAGGSTTAQRAE